MTAPWTRVLETGSGKITGVRLAIDGWPYEFVSHASMVATVDGRSRINGLRTEGLRLEAHADPIAGELRSGGFRAKVADIGNTPSLALAQVPSTTTYLTGNITAGSTTINVLSTAAFAASGYAHIGQETFQYTGTSGGNAFTGCVGSKRGEWGTLAMSHFARDGAYLSAPAVTDFPLIMEGRRARLYIYAEGDSYTGNGTQVYLGVVSRDPSYDGKWWEISIDPITRVLDQSVGGDLADPVTPRGIYYSAASPLRLTILYSASDAIPFNTYADKRTKYVMGFYETQEDFCDAVNVQLAAAVSEMSATTSVYAVSDGQSGWHFEYHTDPSTPIGMSISAHSLVDKFQFLVHQWVPGTDQYQWTGVMAAASQYETFAVNDPRNVFVSSNADDEAWGSVPRGTLGNSPWLTSPPSTDWFTYPPNRLYLGGDVGLTSNINAALINGEDASVTAINASGRYVTTDSQWRANTPRGRGGLTWTASSLPEIRLGRWIASNATFAVALQAIIDDSGAQANTGALPVIQAGDFVLGDLAAAAATRVNQNRLYWSWGAVDLKDLIAQECRLLGVMPAITAAGAITFRRVRMLSDTEVADHAITAAVDLKDKQWVSLERSALGIYNSVEIHTGYDARSDQWNGTTYLVRDVQSFSACPVARTLTIKPYSRAYYREGFDIDDAAIIGSHIFGLFGGPYEMVTVEVPLTLFGALIGDSVALTIPQLPDTDGTMGVTTKRGLIVGTTWDIWQARGSLDIIVHGQNVAGYAPAVKLSGTRTDHGSDEWTVNTLSPQDYLPTGTDATDWFAANERVVLYIWGNTTNTRITGEVVSVTATAIRVQLDATWTPGAYVWVLGIDVSTAVTVAQRAFAFIAEADATLDWAGAATGSAYTLAG